MDCFINVIFDSCCEPSEMNVCRVFVRQVENGVRSVAVETVEESSRLNAAQRKLARIMSHVDSE